ncbi:MAG TPA: hypothetical protein DCL09_04210 [Sutterella sp.]|nr:hypothetical protein [Sutterella sp.]
MHQRLLVIDGRSRTGPVTSVLTKKHLLGQALFQDTKNRLAFCCLPVFSGHEMYADNPALSRTD